MIQYGTCTVYDSVWCMVKQNLLGVVKGQGRVKVVKVLFVVRREINKNGNAEESQNNEVRHRNEVYDVILM